jgi:hypothetical protein
MKKIALISALVANMLLTSATFADDKQLAEAGKILEFYRTEDLLEEAMPCMEKHLVSLKKDLNLTQAQQNQVKSLIKRIYPAKNMYKLFKEIFAANFTSEKVSAKLSFINSATGIKLRQAYALSSTTPYAVRKDFYDRNEKTLFTVNRRNVVMTFITSSEQDRAFAALESRCYLALNLARNAYMGAAKRVSIRQLKDAANKRESSYVESARKKYEIFDFFLFKDFELKDIDDLTKYYSSADGQVFTKAYKKSIYDTMESAANTLYDQITNPPKKKK